ncbi:hypothetical protein C3B47_14405 [Flavobacterium columnare]|uniref:Uncharacterized protein n=1 Tax=Flavobacterium columnare (strain ATCC 49512 / CIP 103533 / TG 44/87) TaxID=1041826 RepID=G8XA69_FLACA|nr:hypothetical protein [Flavobacterium columnare]AEW85927.1 hypothetical protein FCOL_05510 [Flavobacterium columnare ATCC 49512]MBF6654045.1 hypothetical protein [Flavobacterium columnare]
MRKLAYSPMMKGDLDDDYTLFENGEILHEYDAHRYPRGYNLKRTLQPSELKQEVKERLLKAANENDKDLVKNLLGL